MMNSKISKAITDCNNVHEAWRQASTALKRSVSNNGYGIFHYQGDELRRNLREAQEQIQIALNKLEQIDWPTDEDYDEE